MKKNTQCRGGLCHRTDSFLEELFLSSPWFAVGHMAQESGSPLKQVLPLLVGHHLN